jgi:hypothetical protein
MPHLLIIADWIVAMLVGIPSALFFIAAVGFYVLRPCDAQFAGIAGYAALFFSFLAIMFAGLFALAGWGGSRNAEWAVYVQIVALLCAILPIQTFRTSRKAKKRNWQEYEELKDKQLS